MALKRISSQWHSSSPVVHSRKRMQPFRTYQELSRARHINSNKDNQNSREGDVNTA